VKNAISDELNQLCTGCAYCRNCPEGIEVWKFVETTNHLFLKTEIDVSHRLKYDWGTTIEELDRCTECLTCVESCTQHLPILQRFELLKRKIDEQRNKRK
jgi:predicted aldo/keto reductase-like oxidoreductase